MTVGLTDDTKRSSVPQDGIRRALPQWMTSRWVSFAFSALVLHATIAAIDPVAVNNPQQGYCAFVVAPKLKKFREKFAEKRRKGA